MRLVIYLILTFACSEILASQKTTINVYTYDSFASEWGPGPTLKEIFQETCKCEVKFITVADGYSLLAKLKLEKSAPKADVVIGIDDTLTATAQKTEMFAPSGIETRHLKVPTQSNLSPEFVPYDYGYFAFMFDTKAKKENGTLFRRPRSMADLLESPEFRKAVIIQDPRSSTPGFALLLWLRAIYKKDAPEKYRQLKNQVLTISPGWSESYKLFTKGEAPLVFSYTTSEAYHREMEKTDRYQALIFTEGHYTSVEYAAILKSSKNIRLGQKFIEFLTSDTAQAIIASKNWMYPVKEMPKGKPNLFPTLPVPNETLRILPTEIRNSRETWMQEWQNIFSKN